MTLRPLSAAKSSALTGAAAIPGDKSISHRALMLGGLAVGQTRITGLLEGDDVFATAAALRALGVTVTREAPGAWTVSGVGVGGLAEPSQVLDMGNSGTAVPGGRPVRVQLVGRHRREGSSITAGAARPGHTRAW